MQKIYGCKAIKGSYLFSEQTLGTTAKKAGMIDNEIRWIAETITC